MSYVRCGDLLSLSSFTKAGWRSFDSLDHVEPYDTDLLNYSSPSRPAASMASWRYAVCALGALVFPRATGLAAPACELEPWLQEEDVDEGYHVLCIEDEEHRTTLLVVVVI